jgi:hypothetical protein
MKYDYKVTQVDINGRPPGPCNATRRERRIQYQYTSTGLIRPVTRSTRPPAPQCAFTPALAIGEAPLLLLRRLLIFLGAGVGTVKSLLDSQAPHTCLRVTSALIPTLKQTQGGSRKLEAHSLSPVPSLPFTHSTVSRTECQPALPAVREIDSLGTADPTDDMFRQRGSHFGSREGRIYGCDLEILVRLEWEAATWGGRS